MVSLFLSLVLLLAQKPAEKPKVHADFQFGSYPSSREGNELMGNELAREIVVAYHEGWSIDKIAKTLKLSVSDVSKVADKLEDEKIAGRRDDFDIHPFIPVIRERDYLRVKDNLSSDTQEFTKLILNNWKDIESMLDSLDSKNTRLMPKDRVMYETVVSGVLLGGMIDAFYEDKTLMPPPPRRGKTERYFGWLVESNPAAAGLLRREIRESAGYRIITIGNVLPDEKQNPDDLRGKVTFIDEADARKYRAFIGILCRDKLLPYFKTRRSELLKTASFIAGGRYVAFAEVFAWYYNAIANGVADALVAAHRITPPEKLYTYAIFAPQ